MKVSSKQLVTVALASLFFSGCIFGGSKQQSLSETARKAINNYHAKVGETEAQYPTHVQFKASSKEFSPFAASAFLKNGDGQTEVKVLAVLPDYTKGFYQAWILKDSSYTEIGILEYKDPFSYTLNASLQQSVSPPYTLVLSQETTPDEQPEAVVANSTLSN